MKPTISIDVFSDVVCPWCYIGKRRLEKAIAELYDTYTINVRYLPFELNPTMPPDGANQKEYLTQKFGGQARYDQITAQVTKVAADEGLEFRFDRQSISPNTRKAHQVIHLALEFGVQQDVKEAYMRAYFTEGLALNDDENLVAIAVAAGMPEAAVRQAIHDPNREAQVVQLESESRRLGITGVPFYVINQKYGMSGAQPTEVFVNAIRDSVKEPA